MHQTTRERIHEQNFSWYSLNKDIANYIFNCEPCQRNEKIRTKNHEAISIEVEGFADTIAIDNVLGLPETDDGYKGISVYSQFNTKYVALYPIKTK